MRIHGRFARLPVRLGLAGLALTGGVAHAAEAANFGVNFRDYDIFDSRQGYVAGDIKSEHAEADFHDGRAVVRDGKARASFGTLGISSFAATSNNGGGSPIVFNSELVKAWSYEVFHFGGSAVGTPITLTFTAVVDIASSASVATPFAASFFPCPIGAFSCPPTGLATANGGIVSDLAALISFDFNDVFDPLTCLQFAGSGCTGPRLMLGVNRLTITRIAHIGETLALRTRFEAFTGQYHPITYATGYSSAGFFALNTAQTFLSVSSPDVVVTTQSGHDYALSTVPEPASWALLLSGFALVGAALRRSRVPVRVAG